MTVPLIRWDAPGPYVVAFSGREGGVSAGPYAALNLGLLTSDDLTAVHENRRRLFAAVAADEAAVSWPRQVHGCEVIPAGTRGVEADGMWSDRPREGMVVLTADCAPVALVRVDGRPAAALAHVGWRGLLAGVVERAVQAIGPGVAAAVGPAIGPCCYEVGEDVAAPVRSALGAGLVRGGRLDLPAAIEAALRLAGCTGVEQLGECTACNPGRYFSHRRDAGLTGRQGAIAYVA